MPERAIRQLYDFVNTIDKFRFFKKTDTKIQTKKETPKDLSHYSDEPVCEDITNLKIVIQQGNQRCYVVRFCNIIITSCGQCIFAVSG